MQLINEVRSMAEETKKKKNGGGLLSRRDVLRISGFASGAAVLGYWGSAVEMAFGREPFPSRKLTWIVGAQPGGGNDLYMRGLAPYLQKYLKAVSSSPDKVGVVVKNMPGSSGVKAINAIRNSAKPDGYTMCHSSETLHAQAVLGTLGFDPFELTFVFRVAASPKVLVTNSKSNIRSWDDLVKLSKKNPVKIGVTGFGTANHIAAFILPETTGLNAKPVIFDGSAGLSAAMIRQDVPVGMYSEDSVGNLVDIQELRPLLTFSEKTRWKTAQNVKDIGFPELNDALSAQRYVIAPPGVPQSIRKILASAFHKALMDKGFLAWNEKMQICIDPASGADLDKVLRNNQNFYQSKAKLLKAYLSDTAL
jgi:tripartite-type tricarboxylate transporter receptor subunit TctC